MSKPRMSTRRKRMLKQKRKKQAIFAGLILACIFVLFLIVQLVLWNSLKKNTTDKILQGVYIGTSDVSGMSIKEATAAVEAVTASYQGANLTLQLDEGRTVVVSAQDLGVTVADEKAVVEEAYNYGRKGSVFKRWRQTKALKKEKHVIDISYIVNDDQMTGILTAQCEPLLKAPVNASVSRSNDASVVVPGEAGEVIDAKATISNANTVLKKDWNGTDATIKVKVIEEEPDVTEDDLKDMQDLLGSYTTYYNADGTGHAHNVELGATNVGGRIVGAGKSLSVEEALKPTTEENGYEKAGSYASGAVVETYGGGICQVSTTLYNAVLYAELEIKERHPHSMLVNYVDPSRDAAIAENQLDFIFKNNYKSPIYIESVLENGYLTFNIYGKETRAAGRTVEFESEVLQTEDLEGTTYVTVDQPIGYFLQVSPYQGMDAQLWKVVYQDGVEVSRDVINTSHYQATKLTYNVGIQSDNANAVAIVSNAVASQNADTIQNAINEALNAE